MIEVESVKLTPFEFVVKKQSELNRLVEEVLPTAEDLLYYLRYRPEWKEYLPKSFRREDGVEITIWDISNNDKLIEKIRRIAFLENIDPSQLVDELMDETDPLEEVDF